jgi:zinc D-Ala-D-Ala dipeptidase
MRRIIIVISLCIFCPLFINAQELNHNEYGLPVVNNLETYYFLTEQDSNKIMIDIEEFIPDIVIDIRYASENNFLNEPVYNISKAFARLPVARALKNIQQELKEKNLGLKIFDAYRPFSVTVKFYEKVMDTTYVASPWKGSRHNRGCAVDLTIIDLSTRQDIPMPTDYDDFTYRAAHDFMELDSNIIENRNLLADIMVNNGFAVYPSEWWHYDFISWENYELMDLSFEDLVSLKKLEKSED